MNKIKLVIIDLDDTIYSEYDFIQSGFRYVAEYISSYSNYSVDFLIGKMNNFFNVDKKTVFDQLIDFLKGNEDLSLKKLIELYKFHTPRIKPYDDFYDLSVKLERSGIKLVLLTDGDLIQQKNKVEGLKIEKYFKKIYYSDTYGIHYYKPNPKIYLEIINDQKVNSNEVIVIGDNPNKDFYCKKTLGFIAIQIIRPNAIYALNNSYFEDVKPNQIIESLNEIRII